MQTYPDEDKSKPLLPPWATEEDFANAVRTLDHEIHRMFQKLDEGRREAEHKAKEIDNQVKNWAPIIEREAEAFLKHEAEGW